MAGKLKQLKCICRISFNERNQDFRRNKTNLAIFNNFCRSTGELIAENTPVCNNISILRKSYYLFLTIKTCLEYFYYPFMNTKKSAYPVTFLVKNIAPFILTEIFSIVKRLNFIRGKIFKN